MRSTLFDAATFFLALAPVVQGKPARILTRRANPASVGPYTAQGCYSEATSGRALTGTAFYNDLMTVEKCAAACSSFTWFGVEYGRECFCGNTLNDGSAPAVSGCDFQCPGDSTQTCGGRNRLNMYQRPATTSSSSTSAPPASTPTPGSYAEQGCYTEATNGRALTGKRYDDDAMTIEKCSAACSGFKYFGVEYYRECYCGNELQAGSIVAAASTECRFPCGGDRSQTCGGDFRLNLYQFGGFSAPFPPTTTTPAPTGYTSDGCFTEATNSRALTGATYYDDNMTTEKCAAACKGFTLFGTEFARECYCGNTLQQGSVQAPSSECNKPCAGNKAQFCGAGNRLNVYHFGNTATTSTVSSSTTSTSSSTSSVATTTSASSTSTVEDTTSMESTITSSSTTEPTTIVDDATSTTSLTADDTITSTSMETTSTLEPTPEPTVTLGDTTSSTTMSMDSTTSSTTSIAEETTSSSSSSTEPTVTLDDVTSSTSTSMDSTTSSTTSSAEETTSSSSTEPTVTLDDTTSSTSTSMESTTSSTTASAEETTSSSSAEPTATLDETTSSTTSSMDGTTSSTTSSVAEETTSSSSSSLSTEPSITLDDMTSSSTIMDSTISSTTSSIAEETTSSSSLSTEPTITMDDTTSTTTTSVDRTTSVTMSTADETTSTSSSSTSIDSTSSASPTSTAQSTTSKSTSSSMTTMITMTTMTTSTSTSSTSTSSTISASSVSTNLIRNPGFEDAANAAWSDQSGRSPAGVRNTAEFMVKANADLAPHSGSQMAAITLKTTNVFGSFFQRFPVTPNAPYVFSAWYWLPRKSNNCQITFYINKPREQIPGTETGYVYAGIVDVQNSSGQEAWTEFSAAFDSQRFSELEFYVQTVCRNGQVPKTLYFDDIDVHPSNRR